MDNHSRYSRGELVARRRIDAQIYTIAVSNLAAYTKPIAATEANRGLFFSTNWQPRPG
jgi:hypothetical protein